MYRISIMFVIAYAINVEVTDIPFDKRIVIRHGSLEYKQKSPDINSYDSRVLSKDSSLS